VAVCEDVTAAVGEVETEAAMLAVEEMDGGAEAEAEAEAAAEGDHDGDVEGDIPAPTCKEHWI
jgi:hypothetical protein